MQRFRFTESLLLPTLRPMFSIVLSVLLMGMLPVAGPPSPDQAALQSLNIAAPLPLSGSASLLLDNLGQRLTASGVVVMDLATAQTVYERHADIPRPMGSLTKLMTALIIVENHGMEEVVTVPAEAAGTPGSSAHLVPGEQYMVGDLLKALLVPSANDAARTLAVFHAGSEEEFVMQMNARARMLGLRSTSFANAAGFDDSEQYTTPRDLAWLAAFVLQKPELRQRLSLPSASIRSLEGRVMGFPNTNVLLRPGSAVEAGKTGTTDAAGQCLFSLVHEGGREEIVVLLGSRSRFSDMRSVMAVLPSLFL